MNKANGVSGSIDQVVATQCAAGNRETAYRQGVPGCELLFITSRWDSLAPHRQQALSRSLQRRGDLLLAEFKLAGDVGDRRARVEVPFTFEIGRLVESESLAEDRKCLL